jgi:hypothetical protein
MDISAPEELAQPVLTAEAVRKTLPYVCLKDDGSLKSEKSIKNILSGFNQMLKVGLLDESRLSVQMESEFELTKKAVKAHEAIHGKKSWPSFLNDIRAAANEIINFDTSDMTFAQTLTVLAGKKLGVSLSKYNISKLLHQLEPSVSIDGYYNWMLGKNIPRFKRTTDAVLSLDIKLNANGALKEKVKKAFIIYPEKDDNDDNDDNKKVSFILPSSLNKEIDEYIDFRLNNKKPKEMAYLRDIVPTSKEEKRELNTLREVDSEEWSESSAETFKRLCIFFAQYIEQEHPEKFKYISLATLFNSDFLGNFENYVVQKGTINLGLKVLKWIRSECSANSYVSVYLYSEDEFCKNINDWIEELNFLNTYIKKLKKKLENKYKVLEGARNVEWILGRDNPIECVRVISEGLWHEANYSSVPIGPTAAAIINDMLLPCPIRATNVSNLRWLGKLSPYEIRELHKTETCALYFDKNKECFTIFVHKEKLKNRKSTTIKSIVQPLPHLSDKFQQYLDVRKKYLENRGWETETLFPLMKIATNIKKSRLDENGNIIDFRIARDGIHSLLSKATKSIINIYYPEENIVNGINPHGMRHLAASLFLRDNPENYTGLATLLMDNLETVTRIYARRDDVGNHQKIANWAEGLMGLSNAA